MPFPINAPSVFKFIFPGNLTAFKMNLKINIVKQKKLLLAALTIILVSYIAEAQTLVWTKAAPGVWKCIVGTPEKIDLFNSAGINPDFIALSEMTSSDFPFNEDDIKAEVIYNDYYSHEDFITALINSGYSGVLWTPEVRSSKTSEEWLRRMQTVIFSPMAMINAWSSGTKPWSFPEVEKEVREIAMLRMQLMPYFYSEFAKYHFEGTPLFRGMNLE